MKIALTICSANYLPFAKTLGDSIKEHNPEYTFIIVVLDKLRNYNLDFFAPHKLVFIEEMKISEFEEMNRTYTIFELSCALKPFVIEYYIKQYPAATVVSYFDSDIIVFGGLSEFENQLNQYAVILTPHICTPLEDDANYPNEEILLKAGIYNAGFFAVNNSDESAAFLLWWKVRMKDKCLNKTHEDQLWLNFVPIFFTKIKVLTNPGYNVAYWNLHERSVEIQAGKYIINRKYHLVFYHFSGYDINKPDIISKHQNRYYFKTRPELLPLYQEYREKALKNNYQDYVEIQSSYGIIKDKPAEKKSSFFRNLFK